MISCGSPPSVFGALGQPIIPADGPSESNVIVEVHAAHPSECAGHVLASFDYIRLERTESTQQTLLVALYEGI